MTNVRKKPRDSGNGGRKWKMVKRTPKLLKRPKGSNETQCKIPQIGEKKTGTIRKRKDSGRGSREGHARSESGWGRWKRIMTKWSHKEKKEAKRRERFKNWSEILAFEQSKAKKRQRDSLGKRTGKRTLKGHDEGEGKGGAR